MVVFFLLSSLASAAFLRLQAAKSWRIVVGNQGVPLSEIRSASTLGPNFLVLASDSTQTAEKPSCHYDALLIHDPVSSAWTCPRSLI